MGIQGLPRILPRRRLLNRNNLFGKRAAIDTLCWIYNCAHQEPNRTPASTPPKEIASYFVKNVKLLRSAGMSVLLVFEGAFLRLWKNRDKPTKYRNADYHASGNFNEERFSDIAYEILEELSKLRDTGVSSLGAPNEADAQLAYLAINGFTDVVISNDTDLIAYGCPWIFFELNVETWMCKEFHREAMINTYAPNLSNFQILQAMLLTGCDYIKCLPNQVSVSFLTAVELIRQLENYSAVINYACAQSGGDRQVFDEYKKMFQNVIHIFLHQKVYCLRERKVVYLTPINANEMCNNYLWFLGETLDDRIASDIAQGFRYPYPPYYVVKKHIPNLAYELVEGINFSHDED